MRTIIGCIVLFAAAGCNRSEGNTQPAPAQSAAPTSQPSTASSAPAAVASAQPTRESLAPAATPIPEDADWDAAKEVMVTGSTERRCETKVVGEYLRVRCRNRNAGEGRVTGVGMMTDNAVKLTRTHEEAVVIAAFLPGTKLAVRFDWRDSAATLVVQWLADQPRPEKIGKFWMIPPAELPKAPCAQGLDLGPEDLCLYPCTSHPVDTCGPAYSCEQDDVDGGGIWCVPLGKKW